MLKFILRLMGHVEGMKDSPFSYSRVQVAGQSSQLYTQIDCSDIFNVQHAFHWGCYICILEGHLVACSWLYISIMLSVTYVHVLLVGHCTCWQQITTITTFMFVTVFLVSLVCAFGQVNHYI